MIWSVIIGILLALYVLWVVRRKIRQFRSGKFAIAVTAAVDVTVDVAVAQKKKKTDKLCK